MRPRMWGLFDDDAAGAEQLRDRKLAERHLAPAGASEGPDAGFAVGFRASPITSRVMIAWYL